MRWRGRDCGLYLMRFLDFPDQIDVCNSGLSLWFVRAIYDGVHGVSLLLVT